MTIFGNFSRVLNRVSGGPRGQTLCARIAERWPECWFCRLMSRTVEPNHCAIELEHWRAPRPPRQEIFAEQTDFAYAQLIFELANWSSYERGTKSEFLGTSGRAPLPAEAVADVWRYVALSVVVAERLSYHRGQKNVAEKVEPAEHQEVIEHR